MKIIRYVKEDYEYETYSHSDLAYLFSIHASYENEICWNVRRCQSLRNAPYVRKESNITIFFLKYFEERICYKKRKLLLKKEFK